MKSELIQLITLLKLTIKQLCRINEFNPVCFLYKMPNVFYND